MDNLDALSWKSCPVFRPSQREKKDETFSDDKHGYLSSSSLSELPAYCLQSTLRKHGKSPDKTLKGVEKALTEKERKKRTKQRVVDLASLQALAKKQQQEELNLGRVSQLNPGKIGLETLIRSCANKTPHNLKPQNRCDVEFLSSRSCTFFGRKQATKSLHQNLSARISKSVDGDAEPVHVADTPALGVKELKRRLSVRAKTADESQKIDSKGHSKLTQTSSRHIWPSEAHLTPINAAVFHKYIHGDAKAPHRTWSSRVAGMTISQVAEMLALERETIGSDETDTQFSTKAIDSAIFHNRNFRSEGSKSHSSCHEHLTDMRQIFSAYVIPPPPEFDCESPRIYPSRPDCDSSYTYRYYDFESTYTNPCQPNADDKLSSEAPPTFKERVIKQLRAEDSEAKNFEAKGSSSPKVSSRATRSRSTQTAAAALAGDRRSRRVTYSPSEVSGASEGPGEQSSAVRRLRRGRRRRQEPLQRTSPSRPVSGGSRPVSGRSSPAVGSRPVSSRSHTTAEGACRPALLHEGACRPALLQEVHRRAKDQKKGVAVKRRGRKRKVFQAPKNMPEAIARFLEQLSKDKEAIRVIHKMSLVINKRSA